jgi:hypothetical protein
MLLELTFLMSNLERCGESYHVKIYCVWLFLKLTSAGLPIGIPRSSRSQAFSRSGSTIGSIAVFAKETFKHTHRFFDPNGLAAC